MNAPRIAIDDLGGFAISEADDLPGQYVIDIGGAVELEASLVEFEVIAANIAALVAGQRYDNYRAIGGEL